MGRMGMVGALVGALILMATAAKADPPHFSGSDLPPPPPERPQPPSLYDTFAAGPTSPLGAPLASSRPEDYVEMAVAYLRGRDGKPQNPQEAAYWLKQIVAGSGNAKRERGWALLQLGLIAYDGGPTPAAAHQLARELWELAGAWDQPDALCNLGELAETGDDVEKPDRDKAIVWYTRARAAGCAKADAALTRLKP
jgi:TPR repeat protein